MAWFVTLLFLDALVDFFTVYGNLFRRIDTNTHLVTFHTQHGDSHIITDHQGLSDPASQNQHSFLLNGLHFQDNSLQKENGAGFLLNQA
ncbi:conserved hypothetical protein [Pseudomonas sp. 8O]|nr:conserved hypothetical protein [Pseudomonas sp. 8O]